MLAGPVLAGPVLAGPVLAVPVLAGPGLAVPVLAGPVLAGPLLAGRASGGRRGRQPGAPRASNGMVPTSSQRTRSPRKTGPSTQDRVILVTPSSPITGSTQVMQTPVPQAMDSSTSTCAGMS